MNKMGKTKLNKLEGISSTYPEAFKPQLPTATIMTGYAHEEYFHAIEVQETLVESKYSGGKV